MKILLIDDEQEFTDLISSLLSFHGHEIVTTNHPTEIDSLIKNQHYALIVTDLMMPEVSGFEVIEKIRAHPNYQKVPIIVLSAKSLDDDDRKTLLRQHVHFVTKPFEPLGLVDQINQLLAESA